MYSRKVHDARDAGGLALSGREYVMNFRLESWNRK
jgi:hypothetical protein